jgi:ethanolamine utilization protein EutA (predicted chaperonin)
MAKEIRKSINMRDLIIGVDFFALTFNRMVINQPSYNLMKTLSEAVVNVFQKSVRSGKIIILVFEADIGRGIGRVIKEEVAPDINVISIDEIKLNDFDYIDIGSPTGDRKFIPVIIKSLVFPDRKKLEVSSIN